MNHEANPSTTNHKANPSTMNYKEIALLVFKILQAKKTNTEIEELIRKLEKKLLDWEGEFDAKSESETVLIEELRVLKEREEIVKKMIDPNKDSFVFNPTTSSGYLATTWFYLKMEIIEVEKKLSVSARPENGYSSGHLRMIINDLKRQIGKLREKLVDVSKLVSKLETCEYVADKTDSEAFDEALKEFKRIEEGVRQRMRFEGKNATKNKQKYPELYALYREWKANPEYVMQLEAKTHAYWRVCIPYKNSQKVQLAF